MHFARNSVINKYFTPILHVDAMRAVNHWKNHDLLQELCRATRLLNVGHDEHGQAQDKNLVNPRRELIHPNLPRWQLGITWLHPKYEMKHDEEKSQQTVKFDGCIINIKLGGRITWLHP